MLGSFVRDVVDISNVKSMVIIASLEVLQNLENSLPSLATLTYDINSITLNDIYHVHGCISDSKKDLLYLLSSRNSSALSFALTLIRKVDYSNTILVFTKPYTNFYNTYFITRVGKDVYDLSEVCMFCHQGRDTLKKVNSWTKANRFTSDFKPARSFKGSFHGKVLRYGCRSKLFYDLSMKRYMELLGNLMNFNISIVTRIGDGNI